MLKLLDANKDGLISGDFMSAMLCKTDSLSEKALMKLKNAISFTKLSMAVAEFASSETQSQRT